MNLNYISEVGVAVVILTTVIFHAEREQGDQPPVSKLFHAFWFGIYSVFVIVGFFVTHKNWWFVLAAALERAVLYNSTLNLLREKRFFYPFAAQLHPSWWDSMLMKIKKFYHYLWALALVGLIIVQFKLK